MIAFADVDKKKALAFLQGAISASSVTGNESNFVAYLQPTMQALGLSPQIEEFAPGRPNIWGETGEQSQANTLLIVGHTDTVHVKGWEDRWAATERENPFGAAIVDNQVWGRGAGDLKAGICAWLMAWRLLYEQGYQLTGKLQFAFVGDEESGEPNMGTSAGIRHYLANIAPTRSRPDFAIYTEPSQLNIYVAQLGFFIADIHITGKTAYFGVPEKGVDALKAAHKIVAAIFAHSEHISREHHHELVGKPFVLITDFSAGGYIAVPGSAKISLIRKVTPDENMDKALADLRHVIDVAGEDSECQIAIEFPAGRDHHAGGFPSVTHPNLTQIDLLQNCLQANWQTNINRCAAPFWSEKSFLQTMLGCPAVYCAPGDISNCHTLEERVDIDEYFVAIKAFATFIYQYCQAYQ